MGSCERRRAVPLQQMRRFRENQSTEVRNPPPFRSCVLCDHVARTPLRKDGGFLHENRASSGREGYGFVAGRVRSRMTPGAGGVGAEMLPVASRPGAVESAGLSGASIGWCASGV